MAKETAIEDTSRHWGLLLLAFFLTDAWWLGDSLVLYLTGRPVPSWLHFVSLAATSLLGLFVAAVYFKRSFGGKGSSLSAMFTVLCGTLTVFAVITAAPLLLRGWVSYVAAMISGGNVNDYAAALTLLGLFLIIAVMAIYACTIAISFMLCSVPLNKTGRAAACLTRVFLKRLPAFLLLVLAAVLAAILLLPVLQALEAFLPLLLPYGFFARYILTMVLAAGKTLFALLLIYGARVLLAKHMGIIVDEPAEASRGSLLFPAAVAISTVALLAGNMLSYPGGAGQLPASIRARVILADNEKNLGRGAAAASEYLKARADLLAFQAYLTGIDEIRRHGALLEADKLFHEAESVYAHSPYIPYFKGLLRMLLDPQQEFSSAINSLFAAAAAYGTTLPEAAMWAINGFRAAEETDKAREALNLAIAGGVFTDRFAGLRGAGEKKLADLQLEAAGLASLLEQRELDTLLEMAAYESEEVDLMALLGDIERRVGAAAGPETYYRAALLAERISYTAYMYEFAQKYMAAFASGPEAADPAKEAAAALFTSYMYVKSGHAGEAEQLMEAMYTKHPGNLDIACDYAYVLLENQKPARATAIIDAHKEAKDPRMFYLQAVASMESRDYAATLQALDGLCALMEVPGTDPPAIRQLDELLYKFLLQYLHLSKRDAEEVQKFAAVLAAGKAPAVLYHYVMGLESESARDYAASNAHYEKLLALNPELAYPYYLLGINYDEMAGRLQENSYPQAEQNLLRFIERRPDVVESYYCLGFVYKNSGDSDRAARAFLRVLELDPRRDNPLYEPLEMYKHALGEIGKIREDEQR